MHGEAHGEVRTSARLVKLVEDVVVGEEEQRLADAVEIFVDPELPEEQLGTCRPREAGQLYAEMQGRCKGGAREVHGRCKGGAREVQGRCKLDEDGCM